MLAAKYEKEISPDWWGNKFGFVSGGLLGAQSKRKKSNSTSEITQNSNKRTAFYEEDQENLYKLVQVCTFFLIIKTKKTSTFE